VSTAIDLIAFEAQGWSFRFDGLKVKAKPPANANPNTISELRQHRELVRTLLSIRDGSICLGDLFHDAALIAHREDCDSRAAANGAARSMGFASYADAVRHFRNERKFNGG